MALLPRVNRVLHGWWCGQVLDTARGCPAAGMRIELKRRVESSNGGGDSWAEVGSFLTNEDGRIVGGPVLKDGAMARGVYEWTFHVGDYFAAAGATFAPCGTPFLGQVPLRFGIDDAESHYHVPLLCSPFSFSTYRGS